MKLSTLTALATLAVVSSASVLQPPVLPLIVRNPYLSIWLQTRNLPWDYWPIFWTGGTVGFTVIAHVPELGTAFPLLGRPQDFIHHSIKTDFPTYNGATYDASYTNLTYSIANPDYVDPVNITLSFFSPITPESTFRQSLPAGYLTVNIEGEFDVNIYIDVNGEWVSGNRSNDIVWELRQSGAKDQRTSARSSVKTWKVNRKSQQLLTEFNDRAEWGTLHFTAPEDADYQSGISTLLRSQFARKGHLLNVDDKKFRIIDTDVVFAFSKSFKLGKSHGKRAQKEDSITFTFAFIQDPVVQFASARGLTLMKPLWASYFPNAEEFVDFHYHDLDEARYWASAYAADLSKDAHASGSAFYEDITTLSARQVMGATTFAGTPENPILFLKEISSNGNFQTVDVIFPAFPFFLYTNPRWLKYLLEPLIEHQLSGQYPNHYSMHDLGTHFPNATGHPDGRDEYMPVEECGNMLIMALALINGLLETTLYEHDVPLAIPVGTQYPSSSASEGRYLDGKREAHEWTERTYGLLKTWTGYLVDKSLIPENQLCTDDFAGWLANQTNLALKGIIGIRAFSEVAEFIGKDNDAAHYGQIAEGYIDKWQEFGISRDKTHAKLAYTWYGSWTTLYNLYADALLCFHLPEKHDKSGLSWNDRQRPGGQAPIGQEAAETISRRSKFIPDEIYQIQSDWYYAVNQQYGLPLDSRHLYTKSDWEFFAIAVSSKKTRTEIMSTIALWVNETATDRPLTDLYETEGDGGYPPGLFFMARPVVGGHFASLALERACGGQAIEGLKFLDAKAPRKLDAARLLAMDERDGKLAIQAPPLGNVIGAGEL